MVKRRHRYTPLNRRRARALFRLIIYLPLFFENSNPKTIARGTIKNVVERKLTSCYCFLLFE